MVIITLDQNCLSEKKVVRAKKRSKEYEKAIFFSSKTYHNINETVCIGNQNMCDICDWGNFLGILI